MLTDEKFGRYEVRERIGAGGMGEVYSAHDTQLHRDVALKILSDEFSVDANRKARFYREARATSALNHPNILTIYEIDESATGVFMVTELVDGTTLREVIGKKRLSILDALKITEQIASALIAAHDARIVHRDIKPENVMVRRDGYVKVLDFGLAKTIVQNNADAENEDSTIKTTPGMVVGSVRYMSPEQARGQQVDGRTDVWSLGIVLYEMLAGHTPFAGATTSDTLAALIYKDPQEISKIVPDAAGELQRILTKALEKDANRRYQTAREFLADVKNLIYRVEHEVSSESRTRMISVPGNREDSSENPTMIHLTASANHPTHVSTTPAKLSGEIAAGQTAGRNRKGVLIIIGAAVILSVAAGYGLYRWLSAKSNLAATAFEKIQIERLSSDAKAQIPAISPDGKYIAYASGEPSSRSLIVRQTVTDSAVTIVPAAAELRTITFSSSGEYIFYTLGSRNSNVKILYQIPTLGGTPKKIIDDIDSPPAFSPDDKRFAFTRHIPNSGEDVIFTANADGSNLQQLISSKQIGYDFITLDGGGLSWSPDGTKIMCAPGKSQGGASVEAVIGEVSAADGQFKIFNPKKWSVIGSSAWLKDGSGFLMIARQSPGQPFQIWKVAYPSGEVNAVTNDLNNYSGLGVSSDGSTLITMKSSAVSSILKYLPGTKEVVQIMPESPNLEGASGLIEMSDGKLIFSRDDVKEKNFWMSDAEGKNLKQLTSDARLNISPSVTADGRFIIFNSSRSGNWRIWRMNADGANPVQLTDSDGSNADYNPVLTPDGKSVVFSRQFIGDKERAILMRVAVEDGSAATLLFSDPQHSFLSPRISPDGRHLGFTSYDTMTSKKQFVISSFDGVTVGAAEKTLEYDFINSCTWSPDGKSFTYMSNEGVPNIWKMSLDETKREQLTDFKSGGIFNWRWSSDGKSLFIVRGIVNSDLVLIRNATGKPAG